MDTEFKGVNRTVKMHLLEKHTKEWMHRYGIGFGLMGEQGIEGIHSKFNSYYRTYASMPEKVQRLRSIMQEHFLSVSPILEARMPPPTSKATKKVNFPNVNFYLCLSFHLFHAHAPATAIFLTNIQDVKYSKQKKRPP